MTRPPHCYGAHTAETSPPDVPDDRFVALSPLVAEVVRGRLPYAAEVDDVVQETLARMLPLRHRLDASALAAVAVVTARNLAVSHLRSSERHRRLGPRLVDLRQPPDPAAAAATAADEEALRRALATLEPDVRRLLVQHHVEQVPLAALARPEGVSPGALAARLARTRGRLRVEYLLASRGLEPPSVHCRGVLASLATGNQRRQKALNAGSHVLACPMCSTLASDVTRRGLPLAIALPLLAAGRVAGGALRRARSHPAVTTGAVTATAVAGAAVAAFATLPSGSPSSHGPPRPSPAAVGAPTALPALSVEGQPLLPLPADGSLAGQTGYAVSGRRVIVQELVDERGFWVGDERQRVLAVLAPTLQVPPLVEGETVTFEGTLEPLTGSLLDDLDLGPTTGAPELRSEGDYIEVTALRQG